MSRTNTLHELVFAFVSPLGTPLEGVIEALGSAVRSHGYEIGEQVRLSSMLAESTSEPEPELPHQRQEWLMDLGTRERKDRGEEHLAMLALSCIHRARDMDESGGTQPRAGCVHVVRSLKHPKEVELLREIYGSGFFLFGISAPRSLRLQALIDQDFPKNEANRLLDKDAEDRESAGQQTRATFELADAFIHISPGGDVKRRMTRIIDLLMSCPFYSPTREEHAMFMAYSAALQSGDLSRQVGAVITSHVGDIIASGANDAPTKGGHYWPADWQYDENETSEDGPDYRRGYDSNERERNTILIRVIDALFPDDASPNREHEERIALVKRYKTTLRETGLLDLTEFGRAVHAEMSALMSCTRTGVSSQHGTMYCTTFPCHNCAKHIIAAGLDTVVYIEPYPKSKASQIHDDAIFLADEDTPPPVGVGSRVTFRPFEGIGPRRFIDLFSLTLGNGRRIRRKAKDEDGARVPWQRGVDSAPRIPLDPRSYLERERAAAINAGQRLKSSGSLGTEEGS